MASDISILKSITFKIFCNTADMILGPPGDPTTRKGLLSLKTIVGVIELNGLLKGLISLNFPPIKPN